MNSTAKSWFSRAARCVFALAGGAGLALVPTSAAAAPTLRVMPLGDSITWGVGSPTTSSYRRPLASLLEGQSRYAVAFVGSQASGSLSDLSNEGHSGYTIDQIRAGIDSWMAGARPDVVLLHIGINDLNRNVDVPNAPNRLKALVDRIFQNKRGVTVLVMGLIPTTPGLEAKTSAFNNWVRAMESSQQQAGNKFRYVEPPALTAAELPDNLHPNDAGYQRMAQAFLGPLDRAFVDGWAVGGSALGAGTEAGMGKVRWADFDGDGRMDYLTVASSGAVSVFLNRGGDGRGGWAPIGQIATGLTTDSNRVRFADFNGDGKADYLLIDTNGSVQVYLNRGGDGRGGWEPIGQIAGGVTTDASRVRFADHDGDGKTDYLVIDATGEVQAYLNRGGDGRGGWVVLGRIATGTTNDSNRVRFADLDGDNRADYSVIAADGSVQTYLNRGGDGLGGWLLLGKTAAGLTNNAAQVSFADFTGDGNADYLMADLSNNAVTVYSWAGGDGHGGWINLGRLASGVSIP
ncbi:FG-GAP-like repeat-containing protein [Stigmatella aurantiaca]|nr:FG-GAP-like repeat-containing protein [Stigmatella aurantiaca]EAU69455.1 FG-GAP repeat domain protein [Stigmatella aurantiaca DW4/3-1]